MDAFDLRLWSGFSAAGGDPSMPAIIDQVSIDSRRIHSSRALFVALQGEHHDGHNFVAAAAQGGAHYALINKEWTPHEIPSHLVLLRVNDPLHAFQALAQAYRQQLSAQVVAIAGSYGKTMVKDLLQAMVATTKCVAASPESFNSQIGVALSLFTVTKEHEVALIEMGISKKYEMDRLTNMIAPDDALVTHIGKKHMATLGNMSTIAGEIIKPALNISKGHWALLPNDPLLKPHFSHMLGTVHFWNENVPALPHAVALAREHEGRMPYRVIFPDGTDYISQATFGFYYFLDLINITVKAAWLLGVSSDSIRKTLTNYSAEPMRTEIWTSAVGTTFINDMYCSDPQSVERALRSLEQAPSDGRRVFVFGGMRGERHAESEYKRISESIQKVRVDHLLLVGSHHFDTLEDEVKRRSPKTTISKHLDHQCAFNDMRTWMSQNDVVLIKGAKKTSLDAITEAFNDSICNNQCLINLDAIQANIASIRAKLPQKTRIMVMVKALAYGTNDVRMAKFLSTCGVDILGVSYIDEGVSLKRAGVKQAIFALNAATYEAAKVVKWGLEVGVSDKELIKVIAAEAAKHGTQVKVHLHVDTGMGRFGCRPEDAVEMAQFILQHPSLILEGIMTHFACSDLPENDTFTLMQARHFEEVINELKNLGVHIPWRHAANSGGALRFDFPQFNMVRLGLAIYGLYSSEATRKALELRLALSLLSRIVGINTCRVGETISYGRSYTVTQDQQKIAVLPIGYFDGLHRSYSSKGSVIIRGVRAPMVGNICMDFMMVDVTDIPNVSVGDSVLFFGEDEYGNYLSPEELAMKGDSIVHELITCLGPRIQRIFVHEEAHHFR